MVHECLPILRAYGTEDMKKGIAIRRGAFNFQSRSDAISVAMAEDMKKGLAIHRGAFNFSIA